MMDQAWELFGGTRARWRRVQAICDVVHAHITFKLEDADATRGASARFRRAARRVPRFRAPRGHVSARCLNIPGALLHRLSR